jgi:hypothetical protein
MSLNKNFLFAVAMTYLLIRLTLLVPGTHVEVVPGIVILFLCYPLTIEGNVYSLFGGFSPNGSVYSLLGVIQIARDEAKSFIGVNLYQRGNSIWQGIGVNLYQRGNSTWQGIGLNLFQIGNDTTEHWIGFVLFQRGRIIKDHIASIHVFRKWIHEPPTAESGPTHTSSWSV